MSCVAVTPRNDRELKEKELPSIASDIIGPPAGVPWIIFLIPDPEDPIRCDSWQSSFARHATNFEALGAYVRTAPWTTSPSSNESSFVYLANMTWGYHLMIDRWLAWLQAWPNNIRLINSAQLLAWNTRKTYLKDLESAGVPVIPTMYAEHIDESILTRAAAQFAVIDLVVKPQVSASSDNIMRVLVGSNDFASTPKSVSVSEAVAKLNRVTNIGSMMIQPFMANIYHEGEISVLVFGGVVSHALIKTVHSNDYRVQAKYDGTCTTLENLSPEIRALVSATLAACPTMPVYARVDMLRNDATGILSVIELELIEPGLFLNHTTDGGMAFANAVLAAVNNNFR